MLAGGHFQFFFSAPLVLFKTAQKISWKISATWLIPVNLLAHKKQLRGDFPEKVLPPRAIEVEDFAVAFLVRLPSWKTLHVRWPLLKKLVFHPCRVALVNQHFEVVPARDPWKMLHVQITLPQDQSKSKSLLHRPCIIPGKLQHLQTRLAEKPCKVPILGPAFLAKSSYPKNTTSLVLS